MRLDEKQYEDMALYLSKMGYNKGRGFDHVDHYWYKRFRKENEDGDNGYQVILNVYDFLKHMHEHKMLRFSISFNMKMNHETKMDFDRCDLMLMRESMDVEEFEGYCDRLYDRMVEVLPERKRQKV